MVCGSNGGTGGCKYGVAAIAGVAGIITLWGDWNAYGTGIFKMRKTITAKKFKRKIYILPHWIGEY